MDAAQQLLQRLEPLRLRDVHERVHAPSSRRTCVHGDYHIANWLFRNNYVFNSDKGDDSNTPTRPTDPSSRKPVLIDWATCGYGNPMIDMVFFLLVSTKDDIVSDIEPWLQRYYIVLTITITMVDSDSITC